MIWREYLFNHRVNIAPEGTQSRSRKYQLLAASIFKGKKVLVNLSCLVDKFKLRSWGKIAAISKLKIKKLKQHNRSHKSTLDRVR